MSRLMKKIEKMILLLSTKLTSTELSNLFILIDGDPPGGPFLDALGKAVQKVNPGLFLENKEEE